MIPESVDRYERDLRKRGAEGKNGLRWATIRAGIEELYRFARYAGLERRVREDLASRLRILDSREQMQLPLSHFELARTGNTIDGLLDMAEGLLERANISSRGKKRHQLRNAAAILGVFSNAPLRNASADLRFGETLFWEGDHWVIRTRVQKTHSRNPELLVLPLEPEYGSYVDAVLVGENSRALLPKLRQEALREKRQLFVLYDGSPTAATYIPRIFRELTGNSFTTTRKMTHTDCAIRYGAKGVEMAKAACHQKGAEIHFKYQQEAVVRHSVARRRAAAQSRRASLDVTSDGQGAHSFLWDEE